MNSWNRTANFLLDFVLFLTGTYGPSFFAWIHAELVSMNGNSFGIVMTMLCGVLLCSVIQKRNRP
ncbi:hypothetical protein D3C76_126390 [compost metagenome]